jgi:hypothetical protein
MNGYIKKISSFILILSFIAVGWPLDCGALDSLPVGEKNSDEAAGGANLRPTPSPMLRNLSGSYFQPDSTETSLFEEEEERNLIKEITVWVIGAAFVGYFIVKVFLEGDEEEPEEEEPRKEIPGGGIGFSFYSFSF